MKNQARKQRYYKKQLIIKRKKQYEKNAIQLTKGTNTGIKQLQFFKTLLYITNK